MELLNATKFSNQTYTLYTFFERYTLSEIIKVLSFLVPPMTIGNLSIHLIFATSSLKRWGLKPP